MKIVDILIDSANLLGLVDEVSILQNTTEETESETLTNTYIARLFELIKFSLRELCSNYVPVSISETVVVEENKFPVANLKNFVRVQNVSRNNESVKFKIINRNIVFEENGEYVVNYATYPEIISLFDDIDFLQNLSPDVMVFGLCAYYSLATGMFEEFKEFYEQYISKAESLKCLKIFELPRRSWE